MSYAIRGGFGIRNRDLLVALYEMYKGEKFTYSDAQRSIPDFSRRSFMKLAHDGFMLSDSARTPKKWAVNRSVIGAIQNRLQTSAGAAPA